MVRHSGLPGELVVVIQPFSAEQVSMRFVVLSMRKLMSITRPASQSLSRFRLGALSVLVRTISPRFCSNIASRTLGIGMRLSVECLGLPYARSYVTLR